ncbi:Beta-1,2-xylosyltransferase 1 [Hypsizygus marmoreus]|uniref:Beta-1,2-xylosyltransferase 1 n=1 Tax=Hypsizygus marmoreus TaxID=39966 RepID=A0A369K9C2_HYPMA|nr:Beta-1,2-xylosyltransferase 1 [Hypsizygus marmoreus]
MFTIFPRRAVRRPVLFLTALGFVVYFAGYLRDPSNISSHPPRVDYKTVHDPPVTVTRVRTAWKEATRTVMAEPKQENSREESSQFAVKAPLQSHRYRPDGLLEVNPDGPHPIYELIRNAEAEWEAKVAHSSKTLKDAVAEYERRYKRPPPLGFDDWWAYVEENDVQLPDEYDQICKDLEPYWGMNPKDLQEIEREWEGHADSYTIGKNAQGSIQLVNYTLPGNEDVRSDLAGGAFQIMELLEDVEEFIPPFRAVFSPHDNPNLHTDYELRTEALKHAAAGTFLDVNSPPEVKLSGWLSACDPMSPAWRDPIDWDAPAPPQTRKTFIYNHRTAMDPCQHPSLLLSHGQFLSHRTGPVAHRKLVPQFSYCPTLLHHDIMAAMPINWVQDILPRSNDPEWQDKVDERLQWRGSNTGIWHAKETRWREAQRARLVSWAASGFGENVTVLMGARGENERVGEGESVKKARWAPALLDVAFAGKPLSCAPETCKELEKVFEYRKPQDVKTAGNYKYILDVDGNGWSSRFKRLITSNSLIFKSTIYPEWFTDRIAPWVHYVPVQVDLSDLYDSLIFFRGDPTGAGAHDDLARKIAKAGRQWSLAYWRKEDLTAYMFRLFLEYARVMNPERATMNYHHLDSDLTSDPDTQVKL